MTPIISTTTNPVLDQPGTSEVFSKIPPPGGSFEERTMTHNDALAAATLLERPASNDECVVAEGAQHQTSKDRGRLG